MKTRYLLIALLCALTLGCQKAPKTEDEAFGDFAKSVLAAGKAKDSGTFINKLSMASVADLNALVEVLKKANLQISLNENEEKPTDAEIRKEAEANVRLFMDSYADVFEADGMLSCVVTAQDTEIKGANVYSMIIWAKHKDGKFRGIKIDSAWKRDDGTIKVITWTQLDGYAASKHASKKKAILECDTVEACDYPNMITYEYVFSKYDMN